MAPRSPQHLRDWLEHVPNKLTLARVAAIPLLIIMFSLGFQFTNVLAALIFFAAALTDFFDGYLARKYKLETEVGALLDPVADKMLTTTGLILLAATPGRLYAWMAIVFICRDIAISGIRLIALERNLTISVNSMGKLKTTFQAIAIFSLMINDKIFEIPFRPIGMLCMWAALGLSLYSAYLYWMQFWQHVKSEF